jgi:hypothetical protein
MRFTPSDGLSGSARRKKTKPPVIPTVVIQFGFCKTDS